MQSRVFGTECEYALMYSPDDDEQRARRDSESLLDHLKEVTPFFVSALKGCGRPLVGEFLENGGRFYIDRGAHPEYATPECASVREAVAHEKAGDRIVQKLAQSAALLMAQAGRPGKLQVFKNNVDAFGTTYGCHENYLAAPRAVENVSFMIPFLVTRQIFTGAGKVGAGISEACPYQLTQRADFIDRVFSDRTSQVRGIINLRKREIPKQGQSRRLHILVGDSNMSEYALWLRAGTTALVLRLLEEDDLGDMPVLESAVEAIKSVSRLFDSPLKLENRRGRYTALDIQAIYLEKVHRFFDSHRPSQGEEEILRLWGRTLAGLSKLKISSENWTLEDDPEDMRRRIDWILKLWLINRMRQKDGLLEWTDYRLKLLDVHYHDLNRESGIFERCQALNLTDRMLNEEDVCKAEAEPPSDTRACTRGMIIQYTAGRNVEVIIKSWDKINIFARPTNHLPSHPFDSHRRMVNRLEVKLDDPLAVSDTSVMERVKDFVKAWD